jgi:hypothetical protein
VKTRNFNQPRLEKVQKFENKNKIDKKLNQIKKKTKQVSF